MQLKLMAVPIIFFMPSFSMQKPLLPSSAYNGDYCQALCLAIERDDQAAIESLFNISDSTCMIEKLLLSKKLDPNIQGVEKGHALAHWAVRANNPDILAALLADTRTNPDIKNKNGCTPLGFAVAQGRVKETSLLLHYGANPNVITDENTESAQKDRHTILHTAIMACGSMSTTFSSKSNYHKVIGLFLLNLTTDPNRVDAQGKTPLHYAVLLRDIKVVELLLDCKRVDRTIKDKESKTAFDYAHESNNHRLIELLSREKK